MKDFILLMHNDSDAGLEDRREAWVAYFAKLRESGGFMGGSSIGGGVSVLKNGIGNDVTEHLAGYIRVKAESLEDAVELVKGNPVYESGGTVEVRELPRD